VNKPDGTIILAQDAQASTRALFKAGAAKGVNYYEVLQVGGLCAARMLHSHLQASYFPPHMDMTHVM